MESTNGTSGTFWGVGSKCAGPDNEVNLTNQEIVQMVVVHHHVEVRVLVGHKKFLMCAKI